jgi:hypothetical protein
VGIGKVQMRVQQVQVCACVCACVCCRAHGGGGRVQQRFVVACSFVLVLVEEP